MSAPRETPIWNLQSEDEFATLCEQAYHAQFEYNPVYRRYAELLGRKTRVGALSLPEGIPFLPISFFKSHRVADDRFPVERRFYSSGTSGSERSTHHLVSTEVYEQSFRLAFTHRFGKPEELCILGLLPSYLEQGDSSLVYMVQRLITVSGHPKSGFWLYDLKGLSELLRNLVRDAVPTVLFGVTYALLDFAEQYPMPLEAIKIIETGGMKGRRKEITRMELHRRLKEAFHTDRVYSEYGMTELLSQAYTDGSERFYPPPWMRVYIRETNDPFSFVGYGRTGGINIIDLANRYSCPFLETQDLGKVYEDGSFEVLGRFDHSDVRGCNLMLS